MKKLYILFVLLLSLQSTAASWRTIYAHGIVDGPSQMQRFEQAFATSNNIAVQFADAATPTDWGLNGLIGSACNTLLGKNVNRAKMHMGQGPDIQAVQTTIETVPNSQSLIIYGCSRGAAATINYVAQHNPTNIKALVLDACPADIPGGTGIILAKLGIDPENALTVFKTIFPGYPENSIPPINAIKNITNKDLPILLIHAQNDKRVSYQNSLMLYQEFKRQGFRNLHIIILPEGRHSFLLQDDCSKDIYLQAVHAFYKKYNLPYNAMYTKQEFDLQTYHPSDDNIVTTINLYEKNIITTYKDACYRNMAIGSIILAAIFAELIRRYYYNT